MLTYNQINEVLWKYFGDKPLEDGREKDITKRKIKCKKCLKEVIRSKVNATATCFICKRDKKRITALNYGNNIKN